ncbi:ABC transporter permease [Streptomyces sp. 549]|uniref:ABC transporter permease n=1 Tax=Streptomyces sp. 549 TaxID=3049076 RepID=UPI0024C42271|nr:ABC transporter permease [Streptomyces sp. 549]MDK1476742.1 ABC transporter permease [Streptomyces sp. 549]
MGRYVARRLLQMIPVFLGVTLMVFLMMYALPGDPVRALYGDQTYDPAQIAAIKADLGLDQPLWKQYMDYLFGLVQGDFGQQIASQVPVSEIIADALPITARLALLAFAFTVVFGIALGMIAGLKAGRPVDTAVLIVTLLFISVPVFVLGYLAQFFFGHTLGWVTPVVQDSDNWGELLLPAMVLGSLSLAYVARLTRTSIAENLRSDYMRTAVAKGLPRHRILSVHLLRNSLIPVVTFLGVDIGSLMAGAVVTEGIFNINGIGSELFEALFRREGSTVVGIVSLIVIIYLAVSLIVDLLYAVLDPRIRYA